MPGFEVISKEEVNEVNSIFKKGGGVLFRFGFDNLRKGSYKVDKFEKEFRNKFKSNFSLAVTSGTAALRVALASIDVKAGDEVITQCFTFVATVEAIIESGAKPVCTDINKTLNMCPDSLERKINKKTKAVIVVHMLGVPANMKEIIKICKKNNLILIEDTAWGIGGRYNNKYLGTLGDIGTFSFDYAKTITTGEGGMLLFKNKLFYEKARAWHDHGHKNNPLLPRWEDTRISAGFNFRMNEVQGAIGLAQLKKFDKIFYKHKKNKNLISSLLKSIKKLEFRMVPKNSLEAAESLIFFLKNKEEAVSCRKELLKKGISTKILPEATTWHFAKHWSHIPSLNSKSRLAYANSKSLLDRAVSLPIFYKMNKDYPLKIRNVVKNFFFNE
jgi:8-amino-3,8-dideoxy-alpha-D-manno-octulosonate transaminase